MNAPRLSDFCGRIPKAELHVHLDGSLRPDTMLELARNVGVRLPATTPAALASGICARGARDLADYLHRYDLTLMVLQTRGALRRVAREFAEDAAADNVRYAEVRFCPALHRERGLGLAEVLDSVLAGLAEGSSATGVTLRVIVCALRTLSPAVSLDLARAAADHCAAGVVGFDLAGAEAGHPARDHHAAFDHAASHGLALTCHAGEAAGPESIREALEWCHARRIGHGTRLCEDDALLDFVAREGITLEVCLTSNLHTRAVTAIAAHPLPLYLRRGCRITLNTDGRLIDGVTLSSEFSAAAATFDLDATVLSAIAIEGFRSAFIPEPEHDALLAAARSELETV